MNVKKMPKTIINHPSVAECCDGEEEGSDYKYWVYLKDGVKFEYGRMTWCTGGAGFNSVKDFLYAIGKQAKENNKTLAPNQKPKYTLSH